MMQGLKSNAGSKTMRRNLASVQSSDLCVQGEEEKTTEVINCHLQTKLVNTKMVTVQ